MLNYNSHGGGCCGISHISDFDYPFQRSNNNESLINTDLENIIDEIKEEVDGTLGDNMVYKGDPIATSHLVEAVLTDAQPEYIHEVVKSFGFKEVNAFLNANSGNVCRVYHYFI